MNELIIELTDISAQDFFGMNNETITSLKNYFPKLKIVARGNKVKAFGDEVVLDEFEKRFDLLTSHFARYNRLDENSLERILASDDSEVTALNDIPESSDATLHRLMHIFKITPFFNKFRIFFEFPQKKYT